MPTPPSTGRRWLERVLTWGVTLGLLWWVFRTVPLARVWQALQGAGPAVVLAVAAAYFVFTFAADACATWATFGWFCAKLGLWDVITIRGVANLLALLNYNLGQGAIVYFVVKKHDVGAARATGTALLTTGMLLVELLLLAAIGSTVADAGGLPLAVIRKITAVGLLAFALYLVLIRLAPPVLARRPVLAPLFDGGVSGHLKALLVRIPHVAGHILFQWFLLRMFGVAVPFSVAAALLPVLFVVGWMPIGIQGLGTKQVAAIALFAGYATGTNPEERAARVVAFSLSLTAILLFFNAVTGLAFLWTSEKAKQRLSCAAVRREPDTTA